MLESIVSALLSSSLRKKITTDIDSARTAMVVVVFVVVSFIGANIFYLRNNMAKVAAPEPNVPQGNLAFLLLLFLYTAVCINREVSLGSSLRCVQARILRLSAPTLSMSQTSRRKQAKFDQHKAKQQNTRSYKNLVAPAFMHAAAIGADMYVWSATFFCKPLCL